MARIPEGELAFEFLRSSGPGGQNVNKVETAVRLRFDVAASPSLAPDVKTRLLALAGERATAGGELVLLGRRFRTREANREDVVARLEALVEKASRVPKRRRATKPSKAARARRTDAKKRRAEVKRGRGRPPAGD
jgi:ribosome-associated protein